MPWYLLGPLLFAVAFVPGGIPAALAITPAWIRRKLAQADADREAPAEAHPERLPPPVAPA